MIYLKIGLMACETSPLGKSPRRSGRSELAGTRRSCPSRRAPLPAAGPGNLGLPGTPERSEGARARCPAPEQPRGCSFHLHGADGGKGSAKGAAIPAEWSENRGSTWGGQEWGFRIGQAGVRRERKQQIARFISCADDDQILKPLLREKVC